MLGSRVRAPAGSPDKISDNHTIIGDFFVLWLFLNLFSGLNSEGFWGILVWFAFEIRQLLSTRLSAIFCRLSVQLEKFLLSLSLHTELWATARRKKWKGNRVKIPNNACCCEFHSSVIEEFWAIALFATGENWEGAIDGTSQKTCLCDTWILCSQDYG